MKPDAFERLYETHSRDLFAFVAYRVGNRDLAEEIVADAFEKAFRARRRFDPRRASEKTWLYTIALNLIRDRARRQGAEGRALDRLEPDRHPDRTPLEQVDDRDQLARAMTVLSDEEREAIALRFGGDMTVPEIAKLLGEPLARVEGRVYRALRKLREELD